MLEIDQGRKPRATMESEYSCLFPAVHYGVNKIHLNTALSNRKKNPSQIDLPISVVINS